MEIWTILFYVSLPLERNLKNFSRNKGSYFYDALFETKLRNQPLKKKERVLHLQLLFLISSSSVKRLKWSEWDKGMFVHHPPQFPLTHLIDTDKSALPTHGTLYTHNEHKGNSIWFPNIQISVKKRRSKSERGTDIFFHPKKIQSQSQSCNLFQNQKTFKQ